MSVRGDKVLSILAAKQESISRAADIAASITSDWQLIKQYMYNRANFDDLTPVQRKKLERFNFIYSHLVTGKYTREEVQQALCKQYKIQLCQAREDFRCVYEIFPQVNRIDRIFEMQIELEKARTLTRKAEEANDFKSAANFQRNVIKILELIPEKEPEIENFEGHTIEAVFNPKLLGAPDISKEDLKSLLDSINSKRAVKINTDLFEELNPTKDNE